MLMSQTTAGRRIKAGRAALFIAAALAVICPRASFAMEMKVVGDQLILTGPVISGDSGKIQNALIQSPGITTVILRDSPGGDIPSGYRAGELFRERNIRTAVSGFCYSSCSRMFLGGKVRVFTDDMPPEMTHVGFHGHYDGSGRLNPGQVASFGLKDWIIRYSDGKADPALVERWIAIPVNRGMIHFYHPGLVRRNGVSTFMCQAQNPPGTTWFDCEPIAKTALDLGIITSLDIISSNDFVAARRSLPQTPAPSGYAAVQDWQKVPLTRQDGQQDYTKFLFAASPRGFAISQDHNHWAWFSGFPEAPVKALVRCAERAGQACSLYAMDDVVVWIGH
jgi:hypothetical protein